jgi:hypothetical protein
MKLVVLNRISDCETMDHRIQKRSNRTRPSHFEHLHGRCHSLFWELYLSWESKCLRVCLVLSRLKSEGVDSIENESAARNACRWRFTDKSEKFFRVVAKLPFGKERVTRLSEYWSTTPVPDSLVVSGRRIYWIRIVGRSLMNRTVYC